MGAMRTMITRTLLFSATLALAPQALAEHGTIEKPADAPSSTVAWTPEVKHALANADAQRGADLSQTMMCASCHGNNGVSWSGQWPSLAGQPAEYTYKMLVDYAAGDRAQTKRAYMMHAIAGELSREDIEDLAAFYASFELPPASDQDLDYSDAAVALVRNGDGKRLIAPCASCHGNLGQGQKYDISALAGQRVDYFIQTMRDYADGSRRNDVYSRMRVIAAALTDEEIRELAHYYAKLDGNR